MNKSEQYFSQKPSTEEKIYKFTWNAFDKVYEFNTSNSVFSKSAVDFGTMLMLESFYQNERDFSGSVLDLGCGYGPVGVMLNSLYSNITIEMVDVNERAVMLSKKNIEENPFLTNKVKIFESDGFSNITSNYHRILTNPPIRAGKATVFSFYEGALKHLEHNGKLYVVIQKKQGAESTKAKLQELFGNCQVVNKKSGYFIFCSTNNG